MSEFATSNQELPRVLVFDQDRDATEVVRDRLEKEGMAVTRVHSFIEALPHLSPTRVDLILISLPEDDWTKNALLTQLRRANPAGAIVAMVADASTDLSRLLDSFNVARVPPAAGESWRDALDGIRQALELHDEPHAR